MEVPSLFMHAIVEIAGRRPKLLYMVTVGITARTFLAGQLKAMDAAGFDVTVVTTPGEGLAEFFAEQNARYLPIPIAREISPLGDLRSLWKIWQAMRTLHPDIVNAGTPKAGLLGMLAAFVSRVPIRIYHLRGLRLETTTGSKRTILTLMERVSSLCAQVVVCNSESLRRRFVELQLGKAEKAVVLGAGTSNGVSLNRFAESTVSAESLQTLRARYDLPAGAPVIGFVGRLVRDKGIEDLVRAFALVQQEIPNVRLLLIGRYEQEDPVMPETKERITAGEGIVRVEHQADIAPWYRLMSLLAFPSYREGFPNAPLEAAAHALPVVGYNVTGTCDAVVHEETGLLVEAGDVRALAQSLVALLQNEEWRCRLGARARARVIAEFDSTVVWHNWEMFYRRQLQVHDHGNKD